MEKQRVTNRLTVAVAAGLVLAVAGTVGAAPANQSAQSADPSDVTCRIEQAPMRDGVELATEVYLPPGEGPFPVILQRTPYNRRSPSPGSDCDAAVGRYFAERGYVLLNQDTRGRYRSGGEFDAMRQEPPDGYDAVEWAAAQSWSNGKVGMIGGSYVGLTQWQAAGETPPHLVAIAPHYSSSDYHKGWTYQGGAFDLWFAQSWTAQTLAPDTLQRRLEAAGMPLEQVVQEVEAFVAEGRENLLDDWLWQLPLKDFAGFRRNGNIAAYYDEWLARPDYDDYWALLDVEAKYPSITVPALITGGWYDIFQEGTIRNFMGMREEGGSDAARTGTQLVIRALCHACPADTTAGEIDFGPDNVLDLNAAWARWFDYWLKGIDNGVADDPPVRLFVMTPPDEGTAGGGSGSRRTSSRCRTRSRPASTCGAAATPTRRPVTGCSAPTVRAGSRTPTSTTRANRYPPSAETCAAATTCWLRRVRSARRGAARRRARLHHRAAGGGPDGDRPGAGGAVGGLVGPRHRLHRQAGGRAPRWLRPQRLGGHRSGAVPQLRLPGVVDHAGRRARLHHRHGLHGHRVPQGAPHPSGDQLVQFPALRPEPEHPDRFREGAEPVPATQRVLHDDLHPSQLVLQVAPDVRAP